MSAALSPKLALSNLPSPPPPGSLQFFDGFYPTLPAGPYTIGVTHTMAGHAGVPERFKVSQSVVVQGPEFTIDETQVASVYPPAGASDVYERQLPFLVLSDTSLPWERSVKPASGLPSPSDPTPWMALLVFAESEVVFPSGAGDPTVTCTVAELLAPAADGDVVKPVLPTDWVSDDLLNSQCQTITVKGATFNAVAPALADLPYLAHVRGVSTESEGEVLSSVLLANRMPQPAADPPAAVRYYAHLVSLEGLGAYLGTNAIPKKPDASGLMDVQIVSLYHWGFTSLPHPGLSFRTLVTGLIASQQGSGTHEPVPALQLPVAAAPASPTPAQTTVQNRLNAGFVPLGFVSGAQEDSFAWYRGPFTAEVPQPLAAIGNPAVPVDQAGSADALMIYLAGQGLFDLSYAAAWNLGRNLALSDGVFSQALLALRRAAASSLASLAQRQAMSHLSGIREPSRLLTRNPTRDRFSQLMADGLGERWDNALRAVRSGPPRPIAYRVRPRRRFSRVAVAPARMLLADPTTVAAVSHDLSETTEVVAAWLAKLTSLATVPFSALVPDPRMLPVESIRFFYIDPAWLDALHAGAMSLALHGSSSHALNRALLPSIRAAVSAHRRSHRQRTYANAALAATEEGKVNASGVLIRSQLVPGWPAMTITATFGGAPLNVLRDACLSDTVRLVLFEGVPDAVTLSEPHQGVLFGIESAGIYPRCVTASAVTGSPIANAARVAPILRTPATGEFGGVLDVAGTAMALAPAVGLTGYAESAVVNWNGTALSTTCVSPRELKATVPASLVTEAGSASITVTSGTGTSLPVSFVVRLSLAVDAIQPAMVQAGGTDFTLTVNGVGFGADAVVQWNGSGLKTTVISANRMTAAVNASKIAGAGLANIAVLNEQGTSNTVTFNIVDVGPSITTLTPSVAAAGGAGFTLVIEGFGFASSAVVQWNGKPLQTAFESERQLRAAVPSWLLAAAATAKVWVASDKAASNVLPFTVEVAKPVIGSITPSFALAGESRAFDLAIEGANLGSKSTVNWNSKPLTPTSTSPDQLIVSIPAGLVSTPGTSFVSISNGSDTSNHLSFLTLSPQPTIALLHPPEVFADSPQFILTVYGGFGAGDFALQMVAAPQLQHFPNP